MILLEKKRSICFYYIFPFFSSVAIYQEWTHSIYDSKSIRNTNAFRENLRWIMKAINYETFKKLSVWLNVLVEQKNQHNQ